MASGDILITLVPVTSANGSNTINIARSPDLVAQFLTETQNAAPAKTLFDISFVRTNIIDVLYFNYKTFINEVYK